MKRSLAAPTLIKVATVTVLAAALTGCSTGSTERHGGRGGADAHHVRRPRRLPGHHRARARRDDHRVRADPGRHPRLDRPRPRARAGRRPRRRHQDHVGRQRRRLDRLVRRGRRGGRRRGARALRRRRRRADRRGRRARARPDPGDQLRHHRGGVRQALQDRPGRRLPRGARGPRRGRPRSRWSARRWVVRRSPRRSRPTPRPRSTQAAAANPELQGAELIYGYLAATDLSTVGMYAPDDPRVSILRDFGMVDAPAVADAIKPGEFYGTVSAEQAGRARLRRLPHLGRVGRERRDDRRATSCSARSPRSPTATGTPRPTRRTRWRRPTRRRCPSR